MAKVTILPGQNLNAIADLAGSNRQNLSLVDDEFEVPDVTQAALDTAFADYVANQVDRDNAFAAKLADEETQRIKDTFDDDERRLLRAFAELLIDEFNTLRALHGLTPRTFAQFRTAIKNKIT